MVRTLFFKPVAAEGLLFKHVAAEGFGLTSLASCGGGLVHQTHILFFNVHGFHGGCTFSKSQFACLEPKWPQAILNLIGNVLNHLTMLSSLIFQKHMRS